MTLVRGVWCLFDWFYTCSWCFIKCIQISDDVIFLGVENSIYTIEQDNNFRISISENEEITYISENSIIESSKILTQLIRYSRKNTSMVRFNQVNHFRKKRGIMEQMGYEQTCSILGQDVMRTLELDVVAKTWLDLQCVVCPFLQSGSLVNDTTKVCSSCPTVCSLSIYIILSLTRMSRSP